MQTNFTPEQLRDPAMASSETILRTCVHCGFCTATCPTYLLLGDELDSPARAHLPDQGHAGGRQAGDAGGRQAHRPLPLVPCLHDDLPVGRALHAPRRSRARLYRGDVPAALARPRHARAARAGAALSGALPPRHERGEPGKPFAGLLGGSAAASATGSAPCSRSRRPASPARSPFDRPGVLPAQEPRRGRVAILSRLRPAGAEPGVQRGRDPAAQPPWRRGRAAEGGGLLRRARPPHGPRATRRTPSRRRNIDAWMAEIEGEGLDAIVITASGCGTTIKDYGFMFRNDPAYAEKARRVSELAKDITEYLASARADRSRCAKRISSSPITRPARCSTASRSARSRRSSCSRPASA